MNMRCLVIKRLIKFGQDPLVLYQMADEELLEELEEVVRNSEAMAHSED